MACWMFEGINIGTLYTRFTKLQAFGAAVHPGILCIHHHAKYHSALHVHYRVIGTLEYFWLLDGLYRHEKLMDSLTLHTNELHWGSIHPVLVVAVCVLAVVCIHRHI